MHKQARLSVSSHLEELSTVQKWFQALYNDLAAEYPSLNRQFDKLNLALAEGFTNAVRHAHAELPSSTPIEVELWVQLGKSNANIIEIHILDQGPPFDPESLNEPEPGSLREGGYGWFLLRRLADQVTYDSEQTAIDQNTPEQIERSQARSQVQRNRLRIVKTSKIV